MTNDLVPLEGRSVVIGVDPVLSLEIIVGFKLPVAPESVITLSERMTLFLSEKSCMLHVTTHNPQARSYPTAIPALSPFSGYSP